MLKFLVLFAYIYSILLFKCMLKYRNSFKQIIKHFFADIRQNVVVKLTSAFFLATFSAAFKATAFTLLFFKTFFAIYGLLLLILGYP